jgi:hypothetical protein
MPGTAQIFGLLPLSNVRKLFTEKLRTVTMDVEIFVRVTNNGKLQVLQAILYHFVPFHTTTEVEDNMYFIHGHVSSIDSSVVVGSDHNRRDYQFAIDAEVMHRIVGDVRIVLLQPLLTICGVVRLRPDTEPEFPELLGVGKIEIGRHAVPGVR